MPSRREFLQIGITATALPLASRVVGADLANATTLPIYKTIYDRRFEQSVEFARRAEALGLAVQAIDGDMTRFWYEDLYHHWRQEPVAVAGLTAHGAMFCFEQLGQDQGLKVVFRAEHRFAERGIEHALHGPLPMLRDSLAVADKAAQWPAGMADVVAECPSGRAEVSSAHASTQAVNGLRERDAEALYTWVIAPARKA